MDEVVSVEKITNFLLDSTILFNFMSYTQRRCPPVPEHTMWTLYALYTFGSTSAFTCSVVCTNSMDRAHSTSFAPLSHDLEKLLRQFYYWLSSREQANWSRFVSKFIRLRRAHTHTDTHSVWYFSQTTSAKMIICAIFYFLLARSLSHSLVVSFFLGLLAAVQRFCYIRLSLFFFF